MLSVELKKTEKVDWSGALKKFIEKEFAKDTFGEHKDAAERVDNLRRDVREAQEKTEQSISTLLRYYNVLGHIDQRFPVNEDNIKIAFTWYDAFKGRKCVLNRIGFERACVMFNVGAIYSHLASQQNIQTMDGLKEAARYFQLAAGVFAQLKEEVVFVVGSLTPDLTAEGCEALMFLMLAQAQECFAERAYRQPMKNTIIAPLAAAAARLYENVYKAMLKGPLAGNYDRSWTHHVPYKMHYFMAMHHLCLARTLHEEEKYGVELAHLQLADYHVNQTRQLGGVTPEVSTTMNMLAAKIQQAYSVAHRDNEQIYHERVPRPEELPAAVPKEMVRAVPPGPVIDSHREGAEVFTSLVPLGVKKSLDKYNDNKAMLVRSFLDELKEADTVAQKKLTELNLPDCLHVMEATAIPAGLQRDIDAFKAANGAAHLLEMHDQVNAMGEEARKMHATIVSSLDTEEKEDTELCSRFGRDWARIPSAQLNRSFRGDLATYRGNIDAAKRSDAILQERFDSYRAEFDLLMLPQVQLEALIPTSVTSQSGGGADAGLRELLAQLDNLTTERKQVAQETEQMGQQQSDGLTAELIRNQRPHEEIIASALDTFTPLRERAAALAQQQTELLKQITLSHAQFMSQRQTSETLTQKEAAVKRLRDAINHYKEIKGNLSEGFDFYGRLQDVLRQLKQKVDDFLLARSTERADILQRVQLHLAGQQPYQTTTSASPAPQQQQQHMPMYRQPVYQQPQYQQPNYQQSYQPPQQPQQPYGGYMQPQHTPYPPAQLSYPPQQQQPYPPPQHQQQQPYSRQ